MTEKRKNKLLNLSVFAQQNLFLVRAFGALILPLGIAARALD